MSLAKLNLSRKVGDVIELLHRQGIDRYLAKIDTTLRGNAATTIDAVLDKSGARLALLAPAVPAMGRITVGVISCLDKFPPREPFMRFHDSLLPQ